MVVSIDHDVLELYATWMARDLESHTVLTFDETEEIHGIGGYVTCEPAGDTGCGRIGLLAVEPRLPRAEVRPGLDRPPRSSSSSRAAPSAWRSRPRGRTCRP